MQVHLEIDSNVHFVQGDIAKQFTGISAKYFVHDFLHLCPLRFPEVRGRVFHLQSPYRALRPIGIDFYKQRVIVGKLYAVTIAVALALGRKALCSFCTDHVVERHGDVFRVGFNVTYGKHELELVKCCPFER